MFKGDLHFYRVDGDLRDQVATIDTSVCPLYLLTGEYDFSCTPEDTLRTARQIPGAQDDHHERARPLSNEREPRNNSAGTLCPCSKKSGVAVNSEKYSG